MATQGMGIDHGITVRVMFDGHRLRVVDLAPLDSERNARRRGFWRASNYRLRRIRQGRVHAYTYLRVTVGGVELEGVESVNYRAR
jgi:hypothetical protein